MANIVKTNDVSLITINNGLNLEITLCSFGASIYNIKLNNEIITLSPLDIEEFKNCTSYFGKSVGRVAGRIKDGKVIINDKEYHVEANEKSNALHGGKNGYSFVDFDYQVIEGDKFINVIFLYYDEEKDLPGNVEVSISYKISKLKNEMEIIYNCRTDKDTLLDLTGHSYFNLSGDLKNDILNHRLSLPCNRIGVLDENLIMTSIENVNRVLDFNEPKEIKKDIFDKSIYKVPTGGYDHCFIKKDETNDKVAILYNPDNNYKLTIYSDYPAIVCYTYNWPHDDVVFQPGKLTTKHYGIALEPELIPLSISKEYYEKGILKVNKKYNHYIKYEFDF